MDNRIEYLRIVSPIVNSVKITPIKLDVWSKLIMQPISMWVTIINTSKIKKQREKERENTQNLFTKFGPILT